MNEPSDDEKEFEETDLRYFSKEHIERFSNNYWKPLYGVLRVAHPKFGDNGLPAHNSEDAQDIVQTFFAEKVSKENFFTSYDHTKGVRLRVWLTKCLLNLAVDWHREETAKKRDRRRTQSLDAMTPEAVQDMEKYFRIHLAAQPPLTPDQLVDRVWARARCADAGQQTEDWIKTQGAEQQELLYALIRHIDKIESPTLDDLVQKFGVERKEIEKALDRLRNAYGSAYRQILGLYGGDCPEADSGR